MQARQQSKRYCLYLDSSEADVIFENLHSSDKLPRNSPIIQNATSPMFGNMDFEYEADHSSGWITRGKELCFKTDALSSQDDPDVESISCREWSTHGELSYGDSDFEPIRSYSLTSSIDIDEAVFRDISGYNFFMHPGSRLQAEPPSLSPSGASVSPRSSTMQLSPRESLETDNPSQGRFTLQEIQTTALTPPSPPYFAGLEHPHYYSSARNYFPFTPNGTAFASPLTTSPTKESTAPKNHRKLSSNPPLRIEPIRHQLYTDLTHGNLPSSSTNSSSLAFLNECTPISPFSFAPSTQCTLTQAFAGLDIEAILASPGPEFLPTPSALAHFRHYKSDEQEGEDEERLFNFGPHSPRVRCGCYWCETFFSPSDDAYIKGRAHDENKWCYCDDCFTMRGICEMEEELVVVEGLFEAVYGLKVDAVRSPRPVRCAHAQVLESIEGQNKREDGMEVIEAVSGFRFDAVQSPRPISHARALVYSDVLNEVSEEQKPKGCKRIFGWVRNHL